MEVLDFWAKPGHCLDDSTILLTLVTLGFYYKNSFYKNILSKIFYPFSIKNIFYEKMDIKLFYFQVTQCFSHHFLNTVFYFSISQKIKLVKMTLLT